MNKYGLMGLLLIATLSVACSTTSSVSPNSMANSQQAAKINIELGLRYLAQGQRERAKEKLLLAQSEFESAQSNAALAYFYEQVAQPEEAEKFYRRAIKLNSVAGAGHNNYGAFLCRQKRYQEAEDEFNQAVQDPRYLNTAGAYENAGLCALMIPDREKAIRYFILALQQNPNMLNSLEEMAQLMYDDGQYRLAKDYLDHYLALTQPSTDILLLGIQIAQKLSDTATVLQYQNQLQQLKSANQTESSMTS